MMVYDNFKNEFVSNMFQMDLRLNIDQINNILNSLDKTSNHYEIFSKTNKNDGDVNGVPSSVYDYIDSKRAEGCAAGTLYIYRLMLEVFFHTVNKNPEYITASDIRDFLMNYQERNPISNRTLDKYRGYICAYFTWMHDYGYIPKNPSRMVNRIRYENKHKDILTDYEAELIREACQTKRETAMIEFLISTACRIGELVRIKLSDIDWERGTVLIFGKGRKERIGFFNARCKIALERYLAERPVESEYLFIYDRAPWGNLTPRGAEKIIRNLVARCDEIAENKHITAHRFRATTATNCYKKGMGLVDIQHLLGHSNPQVSMLYIEQSIDHLHNEYNKYM